MPKEVIKKDGGREPFDAAKIKNAILGAAQRTNLPEERKNEVAEKVTAAVLKMIEGKEQIATNEIRIKIISELNNVEHVVYEAWLKYEQEKAA